MTERLFYGCLEEGSKNSTKEVYVFTPVILLVVWLVCRQDYRETTERIFTELGWGMGLGPEQTPFTSGVDPVKGTDPGFFSHFL